MSVRKQLVVVGAGGFGQEIVWAARNFNRIHPSYDIVGYCDDDASKKGKTIYGCKVLGSPEELDLLVSAKPYYLCAIGNNEIRKRMAERINALGWHAETIIDPSVIAAEYVSLGQGTYVAAGSILSPYANIGDHVIVNHHCSIGHNSVLADFVQVAPGGRVSGAAVLQEGSMMGSNAVVAPGMSVGRGSVVGASSFVVTNVPDFCTVIGNPARVLVTKQKDSGNRSDRV